MNARTRGFTLIEMMVALALVSLMSVAMFQAYRLSQRALSQVTALDEATHDIAAAQAFLRRVLEQAYPFESGPQAPHGLMGEKDRLEVTAPALAAEGSAGLYRFDIAIEGGKSGELVVRWAQDRNGTRKPDEKNVRREALVRGASSISISYLELVELGNGQIEPHWRDSWLDSSTLPALVRVVMTFPPGDKRRWPELVVAPRISTDANCVFDVVSQMCRMPT
jgi:general secretion pathway protein J